MDDSNGLTLDFNLSLATILVIVDFVVRVLAIIYVPRNRRPQTALAWLLAIFFIPYIGILLFLLATASAHAVPLLCYTVNQPQAAQELLRRGVSAIFTDRPDRLSHL